jgi:hypothetical protein
MSLGFGIVEIHRKERVRIGVQICHYIVDRVCILGGLCLPRRLPLDGGVWPFHRMCVRANLYFFKDEASIY